MKIHEVLTKFKVDKDAILDNNKSITINLNINKISTYFSKLITLILPIYVFYKFENKLMLGLTVFIYLVTIISIGMLLYSQRAMNKVLSTEFEKFSQYLKENNVSNNDLKDFIDSQRDI